MVLPEKQLRGREPMTVPSFGHVGDPGGVAAGGGIAEKLWFGGDPTLPVARPSPAVAAVMARLQLNVFPPAQSPMIWCPRQLPNIRELSEERADSARTAYGTPFGVPRTHSRKTTSRACARISAAGGDGRHDGHVRTGRP